MRRVFSAVATFLMLVSCVGKEDNLVLERDQIHELAIKESPEKAHALFQEFADKCHARGDYEMESCALYEMATNYLDQRDTLGMRRLLDRMKRLAQDHPDNLGACYSYYSVLGAYYAALCETDTLATTRQAMFGALRSAIDYQEQMTWEDYRRQAIVPAWNYYNMAVCYDLYCNPPLRDSIVKYLDLADKSNRANTENQHFQHQQIDVSIRDEKAWLLYYDGKTEEALAEMNAVLSLIDSVELVSPNTVITERGEAYGFFVEVYSSIGNYEKALEYATLKAQNDQVRFGVQRNAAVREVLCRAARAGNGRDGLARRMPFGHRHAAARLVLRRDSSGGMYRRHRIRAHHRERACGEPGAGHRARHRAFP